MYLITASLQSSNDFANHEIDDNQDNNSSLIISINGDIIVQVGSDESPLLPDSRLPLDASNNHMEYLDSGTLEPRILSKVSEIHSELIWQQMCTLCPSHLICNYFRWL